MQGGDGGGGGREKEKKCLTIRWQIQPSGPQAFRLELKCGEQQKDLEKIQNVNVLNIFGLPSPPYYELKISIGLNKSS